jgi:hypothetical protein
LYYFKRINKKWKGQEPDNEQSVYSYLKLYKYDFLSRKETAVVQAQDYIIEEVIYSPDGKPTDITCFNIIFADRFGYMKKKEAKMKENEFLRQQFVIV